MVQQGADATRRRVRDAHREMLAEAVRGGIRALELEASALAEEQGTDPHPHAPGFDRIYRDAWRLDDFLRVIEGRGPDYSTSTEARCPRTPRVAAAK